MSLDKFQDYIDFDFNYGLLTYFQLRRAALVRPCLTRPLSKMAVICYVGGAAYMAVIKNEITLMKNVNVIDN